MLGCGTILSRSAWWQSWLRLSSGHGSLRAFIIKRRMREEEKGGPAMSAYSVLEFLPNTWAPMKNGT